LSLVVGALLINLVVVLKLIAKESNYDFQQTMKISHQAMWHWYI